MDRDEESGEPLFPEAVVIPPRLRDAALVLGFACGRVLDGATSSRGYSVPAVEMEIRTTEGRFTFLISRADMSAMANGITEVLCDG